MVALLIGLHVVLGSLAALGMIITWLTQKGSLWHRQGGRAYSAGMAGAIAVSFVVSVLKQNIFLFAVGLFSGYLVYTGYRLAVARDSVRNTLDKLVSGLIMLVGGFMLIYALFTVSSDSSLAIILAVFGIIAVGLGFDDWRRSDHWPSGIDRIVLHVERMGAANIATITAVFVVNVQTNLAFIAWLLPTVVGGFLISYQVKKIKVTNKIE